MSQIGSITSKVLSSHNQIIEKAQEKLEVNSAVGGLDPEWKALD